MGEVEVGIREGLYETLGEKSCMETGVPSPGALLEAIQGFVQFTD